MGSTLHHGQRTPFRFSSEQRPAAPARFSGVRRAFTLVEMLVAMALTLILVYAIAEFYAFVGDTVRDGRAMIEMSSGLRAATQRMQEDLAMITVLVAPWVDDGAAPGYFEVKEGPATDLDPEGNGADADSNSTYDLFQDSDGDGTPDYIETGFSTNLIGDADDFIAFTINSGADPFQGRYAANGNGIGYSRQAEVIWFTSFNDLDGDSIADADEPRYLYRRQLLIMPSIGQINSDYTDLASAQTGLQAYWQNNDISASIRLEGSVYRIRANSLADLSRREYRFAHSQSFPGALNTQGTTPYVNSSYHLSGLRQGEDVILSNLLAFDVRVYDPTVTLYGEKPRPSSAADPSPVLALQPGDPGYSAIVTTAAASSNPSLYYVGQGAYVDLHYNKSAGNDGKSFANGPNSNSKLDASNRFANYGATYDTWSMSYERDQVNQDGDVPMDEGVNGIDDDGINGVDDPGERETSPPYLIPLRSIQVRFRVYDITSRQVRQASVVHDFVKQ